MSSARCLLTLVLAAALFFPLMYAQQAPPSTQILAPKTSAATTGSSAAVAKGTVTSVALSAPLSDFQVSGSPVTTSGTLTFDWNVVPTSLNTANAIVKRDSTGSFTANKIVATFLDAESANTTDAIFASNSGGGAAIAAYSQGTAPGVGVFGSSGSGSGGKGVFGVGDTGVYGWTGDQDPSGAKGVVGIGDIAVYGSSGHGSRTGIGFATDGNVQQERTAGGWVKAMVYSSGYNSGRVVTCFNSTHNTIVAGQGATDPPCGFTFSKAATGDYLIDFGFQVDDRFFSLTSTQGSVSRLCTDYNGALQGCNNSLNPNQVEVTFSVGGTPTDDKFYLIVY